MEQMLMPNGKVGVSTKTIIQNIVTSNLLHWALLIGSCKSKWMTQKGFQIICTLLDIIFSFISPFKTIKNLETKKCNEKKIYNKIIENILDVRSSSTTSKIKIHKNMDSWPESKKEL